MKRILITGANSFIGISLQQWVSQWPKEYAVATIDMIDGSWRNLDFSIYDVVFHVAGIAHVSAKSRLQSMYYEVNRDLAIETAKKAKNDNVKQFIFMSSIIVYGESSKINELRIITPDTIPNPTDFYGDSKLQAETGILQLRTDIFKVAILRPPMIYGKGSKGNYPRIARSATWLPFFPRIDNQRSMIHIINFCEFVRMMIMNEEDGLFFPQNAEYTNTSEMVRLIAQAHGKNIRLIRLFNPFIIFGSHSISAINKAFGSLVYAKEMSEYKCNYRVYSFRESILISEKE